MMIMVGVVNVVVAMVDMVGVRMHGDDVGHDVCGGGGGGGVDGICDGVGGGGGVGQPKDHGDDDHADHEDDDGMPCWS